ncbi:protein Mis18-alpha-like [Leptodactylus fuscus]|uniref:protein Mis18-alpha-like n=1 Tax=Leptodactylus fuscus TaxID=238119 RepID=UPI003F4E5429
MAEPDSDISSGEAGGLVLYLCSSCRLPLADSGDCIQGQEDDKLIRLRAVTENVVIDENKVVSSYEQDAFSTVKVLYCKGCSLAIGAFYVATPERLDHKRDLFNINKSAVVSYCFDNPNKQRTTTFLKSVYLPNAVYMEEQLKKCRTIFGFCERGVAEIEEKLLQSSTTP